MNFFRGSLNSGGTVLTGEGAELAVPPGLPAGKSIVVGIRPEDLQRVDGATPPGNIRLSVLVDLIETVGNEAFIHASAGRVADHREIVAVPSAAVGVDDHVAGGAGAAAFLRCGERAADDFNKLNSNSPATVQEVWHGKKRKAAAFTNKRFESRIFELRWCGGLGKFATTVTGCWPRSSKLPMLVQYCR